MKVPTPGLLHACHWKAHWVAFGLAVFFLTASFTEAQVSIPSTFVVPSNAADTTKPGFVWRIHQAAFAVEDSNKRVELQLAGLLGPNIANPYAIGVALGPGVGPDPATAPITFEIAAVINQSVGGWEYAGNFLPDNTIPGLPGTSSSSVYAAGEVTTWLDLPQGMLTFGVNSDDGFKLSIGGANPDDKITTVTGEFNGPRAAADTLFSFYVPQAGLYAARCIWQQGIGGGNIELFSIKSDGSKVLINDRRAGGIPAFRAVMVSPRASIRSVSPQPNARSIALDDPIVLELMDGSTPVDPATIALFLNGENVAVTTSKLGGVCTVKHLPSKPYSAGCFQNLSLHYVEASVPITRDWTFQTSFALPLGSALPSSRADRARPGFVWNIHQVETSQPSSTERTERQLAGQLGGNVANRFGQSIALAPAAAPSSPTAPMRFEIPGVINLHGSYSDAPDNFPSDDAFPGLPGTTGSYDNAAAELLAWLELPAGTVTLGVNSDDGFRLKMGGSHPADADAITLAEFDGGRPAADTIFNVSVQQAGLYPLRCTWEQSSGAANLEFFSVKPDGTRVLINDIAKGGIPAYRAILMDLYPPSQTAEIGSEVRFSVGHVDPRSRCEWFLNDTGRLGSSVGPTLILTNVQSAQAGTYTVKITDAVGPATSAPATLNVISPVVRRTVPALLLKAPAVSSVNVDFAPSLAPPEWRPLSTVSLTSDPQFFFDLTSPLPPQRFYRAFVQGTAPGLELHLAPAITLTGEVSSSVRLDYINQFGPTDAWVTLATITLTNTSQLYFDTSAVGRPPRLYRLSNP